MRSDSGASTWGRSTSASARSKSRAWACCPPTSRAVPSFSLVVLVSAVFPRIDLGFGFALVGVGGLLGLNRTMDIPRLQQLARGGGLDQLMFPADLAHNAPRVASDLSLFFRPLTGSLCSAQPRASCGAKAAFLPPTWQS